MDAAEPEEFAGSSWTRKSGAWQPRLTRDRCNVVRRLGYRRVARGVICCSSSAAFARASSNGNPSFTPGRW